MSRRAGWLVVLLINGVWFLILPTRSGRFVAATGALSAAGILASAFMARTKIGEYVRPASESFRATDTSGLFAAVFLLPALSLFRTPRIAFLVLDGRLWLIGAWLIAAISLLVTTPVTTPKSAARAPALPAAMALFVFWSSALWLCAVSDLGVGRLVLDMQRSLEGICHSDPLAAAFTVWESHPASEHLFLGWRTLESFDQREPYANHVHSYLFAMYAIVRVVRFAAGVQTYVATNSIPFVYMFVLLAGVTTLLARGGLLRDRNSPQKLLLLFLAYGMIVTTWRFWNDQYRFSSDSVYPLLVGAFIFVYAFLLEPVRPLPAIISACIFVSLSPIHAPMLAVAVLFLFGRGGATLRQIISANKVPIVAALASASIGAIFYLTPKLLIAWKGYTPKESGFIFRAGLDGDTRYFSNMLQSVVAPCPLSCCWGRPAMALLFPAFVPLALLAFWAWRRRRQSAIDIWHLLFFLTIPYLISLILFPQAVSIHPYMYDHLLLIPVVVAGVVAMIAFENEPGLTRMSRLGFVLVASAVLMSNLIGIAQSLATMP